MSEQVTCECGHSRTEHDGAGVDSENCPKCEGRPNYSCDCWASYCIHLQDPNFGECSLCKKIPKSKRHEHYPLHCKICWEDCLDYCCIECGLAECDCKEESK